MKRLNRALETKEAEVLHLRSKLNHVRDEVEVQFKTTQEKYDELHARHLEMEERLEIMKEEADKVKEEHAEYEAVIRRNNGMTISEAEAKLLEIADRCSIYKICTAGIPRNSRNSWPN